MDYEVISQEYLDNFIGGNIKRIEENCETVQEILADAILKRTVPQFWSEMRSQAEKFEAISNFLQINEDIEKQKIYYYAVLRTMIQLSQTVNDKIEKIKDYGECRNYTHLFPVLELLYKNESLSHDSIAKRLGVTTHILSDFFNKTNKFKLWKVQKKEENQYYFINFKGKQVYKEYLKQNIVNEQIEFDELIVYLLDAISKQMEIRQPDIDHIINSINIKYGRNVNVFSSPAVKFKLKAIFIKREIEYKRRTDSYKKRLEHLMNCDQEIINTRNEFLQNYDIGDVDIDVEEVEW